MMFAKRTRSWLLGALTGVSGCAAALLTTTLVVAPTSGASPTSGLVSTASVSPSSSGTEVGVSAARPIESFAATSLADLQALADNGQLQLTRSGGQPAGVAPSATVPSGYILQHPGYRKGDYLYDSDWVYQADEICDPDCRIRAETKVGVHEYVYGRSSHWWKLTYYGDEVSNNDGLTCNFTLRIPVA